MSRLAQNSTYVLEFYKPCQAWAWSSNNSTCSLKEYLVDVLEPALDTILNTKTILELIFIMCHTVFATPTTNFDLKFSQKLIMVVAKKGRGQKFHACSKDVPVFWSLNMATMELLIQLEGGRKMLTVYHNHLKPCTSPKSNKRSSPSDSVNDVEQNEQHWLWTLQGQTDQKPTSPKQIWQMSSSTTIIWYPDNESWTWTVATTQLNNTNQTAPDF